MLEFTFLGGAIFCGELASLQYYVELGLRGTIGFLERWGGRVMRIGRCSSSPFRVRGDFLCRTSFFAILCRAWLERNNRIFREVGRSCDEVWEVVRYNAFSWGSVTRSFCNYDLSLISSN